jgi:hypothetical protein
MIKDQLLMLLIKERDDKTLDFVSYQAQEAILNPNLPEIYKEQVLGAAVQTILKIADRRAIYRVEGNVLGDEEKA